MHNSNSNAGSMPVFQGVFHELIDAWSERRAGGDGATGEGYLKLARATSQINERKNAQYSSWEIHRKHHWHTNVVCLRAD